MGLYLQSWTPYKFRPYYEPGAEKGEFDDSAYTTELHDQNLDLLERTMETHAAGTERTPWLTSGTGVVRVAHDGEVFDFASVQLADDRMQFRQGLHFTRQDVTVHYEKGLRARTRTYPTLKRMVQLFTTSDAAWSMSYPTLGHNPKGASEHVQEQLSSPHELEPATAESLTDIFPLRAVALKYWVGVRADQRL